MTATKFSPQVRFGHLWIDAVTFTEAVARIEDLLDRGQGGYVFTPNVDHVVLAERDLELREAYRGASLRVADGQPLVWLSGLLGAAIPERVAGSDLMLPVLARAAGKHRRVYLLGGQPGVGEAARRVLEDRLGVEVAGVDAPVISLADRAADDAVVARIREAKPDLMLVALGAPKGEIWIHRNAARLGKVVSLSIGAGIDFIAGRVRRAPPWIARAGLEWLFRIAQEPGRLSKRYLVHDPQFAGIFYRTYRAPVSERVRRHG